MGQQRGRLGGSPQTCSAIPKDAIAAPNLMPINVSEVQIAAKQFKQSNRRYLAALVWVLFGSENASKILLWPFVIQGQGHSHKGT